MKQLNFQFAPIICNGINDLEHYDGFIFKIDKKKDWHVIVANTIFKSVLDQVGLFWNNIKMKDDENNLQMFDSKQPDQKFIWSTKVKIEDQIFIKTRCFWENTSYYTTLVSLGCLGKIVIVYNHVFPQLNEIPNSQFLIQEENVPILEYDKKPELVWVNLEDLKVA